MKNVVRLVAVAALGVVPIAASATVTADITLDDIGLAFSSVDPTAASVPGIVTTGINALTQAFAISGAYFSGPQDSVPGLFASLGTQAALSTQILATGSISGDVHANTGRLQASARTNIPGSEAEGQAFPAGYGNGGGSLPTITLLPYTTLTITGFLQESWHRDSDQDSAWDSVAFSLGGTSSSPTFFRADQPDGYHAEHLLASYTNATAESVLVGVDISVTAVVQGGYASVPPSVPEPASLGLMLGGLGVLGVAARRASRARRSRRRAVPARDFQDT